MSSMMKKILEADDFTIALTRFAIAAGLFLLAGT